MKTNPVAPLRTLLRKSDSSQDELWLQQARAACAESLRLIEARSSTDEFADRDTRACVLAVSKSLQWVLSGQSSPSQLTTTARRAIQVFDRISSAAA